MQNLPVDVHSDENCNSVLEKLEEMAEVLDEVRSITSEAFLGALRNLRPWELCNPDVCSAIEFVRQTVVQMPPEEFDEWRQAKMSPKEVLVGSDSKPKQQIQSL